jgi:hypothetical protein
MATKFQKGQEVRAIGVVPQGPVKSFRMDEDGVVYCLIQWKDANGIVHERWFAEDGLVAVQR